MLNLLNATKAQLQEYKAQLEREYKEYQSKGMKLDMSGASPGQISSTCAAEY